MRFVHKTNKCINRSQRCIPHRSKLERNDSPQRSCTSLALGLPTNRGGWHCPGGTAGVWTCRVSDSLQVKTTHQLRPTENNNFTLFTLSSYKTHRTQIVIFTGLSDRLRLQQSGEETNVNASIKGHEHTEKYAVFMGKVRHTASQVNYTLNFCDKGRKKKPMWVLCHIALHQKAGIRHHDSCFFTSSILNKCMHKQLMKKLMKSVCELN